MFAQQSLKKRSAPAVPTNRGTPPRLRRRAAAQQLREGAPRPGRLRAPSGIHDPGEEVGTRG